MKHSDTRSLTTCAAAVLAAFLCVTSAACGTSDEAKSESSSSASTSSFDASKIAKDDEIAAMVPEAYAKDGKLIVGMDTTYAPAEFLNEDGKTPVGYDVDLVKAMAAVMGLEAEPTTSKFDLIIPSVGDKYDIGVSSFTVSPERMEAVDFVTYYKAGSLWVTRKGNPDKVDTADLCGLTVAVQTGTTQEEEVTEMNKQCVADGKKEMEVLSSAQQTDVTTNVATGKAVAFFADSPVGEYAIAQTGDVLEPLGENEGVAVQGVVVKKGDEAMDKAVQAAIQKLMDDGTYEEILTTWGVKSGAIDKSEINPKTN
ncbi:ABC transporter substrate-binding protein [Bifidobacterium gallicum]|uniref:ABC transporter substrate-binding protein n=1 Tax=Bifidobacterium gallicum DSM 20093 = LMG 11596 TaxID=561180 RepID=D1NUT6_9BIFI|nr:ABC transporter substrate-binding protein [Bifidobacterium gallicum]EFA22587.1 ABC transporter, substrate-binding protein, family 3 [Bifidobacterium gallicum DSM 20093 = LMG 11596]KFI59571.1 ABC transporter substrate-binding protein [Bifidobacterium gallicum DSM 20093 = LMG 11596]